MPLDLDADVDLDAAVDIDADLYGIDGEFGAAGLPDYRWTLLVRDPDLQFVGRVAHSEMEIRPRHNDLGTWLIDVPWDGDLTSPAAQLLTPGAGVAFVVNGTIVYSGPVRAAVRTWDGGRQTLSVAGWDDNVVIADRVAHPQPATSAPPYNSAASDNRNGPAETVIKEYVDVNAGPGALVARAVLGLTIEADAAAGSTVKEEARWQQLNTLITGLALAGGVGWRVVQTGPGARQFRVYVPADRTDRVRFAVKARNLGSYVYEQNRPEANYAFVGGDGEGTARTIVEDDDTASTTAWGRIEVFRDEGGTADSTILAQKALEELAEKATRYALRAEVIDTRAHQWAPIATSTAVETYDLGDEISFDIDGITVPQIIRELQISDRPDQGTRVVPVIGTPGTTDPVARLFERLARRVRDTERRIRDHDRR